MLPYISPQSLKDLVDAKAIRDALVVAERNVYKVIVKYGTAERQVSVRDRKTGQPKARLFPSVDSAGRFLRDRVHIVHYQVDASAFDPVPTVRKRPDTSVRMREAHDSWSRAKAEQSLADPRPNVSHEQAMASVQAVIDTKRKTRAGKTALNGPSRN